MSSLETHLARYREYKGTADRAPEESVKIEMWFLGAYHLIEACAAKHRIHIQKHQRVPTELSENPTLLAGNSRAVAAAFRYLDLDARAKFVYGASGSTADFQWARESFEIVEKACLEALA